MATSIEIVKPEVQLWGATRKSEKLIERAGRVCYKSEANEGSDPAKFIRGLLRRGHFSVLEHASATFHIVCDRGLTHELVRHRLASYSQESTRFVDYAGGALSFFDCVTNEHLGPRDPTDPSSDEILQDHFQACANAYQQLRDNGEPAQFARAALPIGVKTEIVATMNFAQWMHVMELRRFNLTGPAHPHIKYVAGLILGHLEQIAPNVFGPDAFDARWRGMSARYDNVLRNERAKRGL